MNAMFLPLVQVGQVGVGLLFALSLLAAMLGVAGLVWAVLSLWQGSQPRRIIKRSNAQRDDAAFGFRLSQPSKRRRGDTAPLIRR
jgi:hypothetical protein